MTESKMMGARVPLSWAEKLEAIALDEGITTAEVCRRALGQFLGKRGKGASLGARVGKLEKQIRAIQAAVLGDDS